MFSATPSNLIFINQLGPCRFHSWKPTNQNLNKCLMKVKEKAKLTTYYGFHIQRLPEREVVYGPYGGPNRGRHYVRQSKSGKNYEHHNTRHGNVHTHYHQRFKNPHNTTNGITLWIWTGQWGVNEPGFGYTGMGVQHNGDRSSTVRNLESWGMKVVNIDDRTAPRVGDIIAHKHKLYQHNFPWLKEPVTNHKYGDADYYWKNEDKIDYASATSKSKGTLAQPTAPGAASTAYQFSIMANSEQAVAAARGNYVAPKITTSATPAAAEKKSEKKVEEKKAAPVAEEKKAAPVAEEKKAAPVAEEKKAVPAVEEKKAVPAVEEKKAAPAVEEKKAAPAVEEKKEEEAEKKTPKKSKKSDKDSE